MKKTLWTLGALMVVAATGLASCANETSTTSSNRPAVDQLDEGLTILDDVAGWGMNGAFRKGDRVVYFETRIGALKPQVYRDTFPEETAHEVDARFVDEEGRTIYVRTGGDEFADPNWAPDLEKEAALPPVDPARRAQDLALVEEASLAFVDKPNVSPSAEHTEPLANARLSAAHALEIQPPAAAGAEVGYAPATNTVEIHGKWLIWLVAEHTATWRNYNGTVYEACNHGTCAAAMGKWCSTSGYYSADPGNERSTSNSSVTSNCRTSYNWNSTGGGHNCHDDSVRALWFQKYGNQGDGYSGVCSNGASHWYGPDCSVTSW